MTTTIRETQSVVLKFAPKDSDQKDLKAMGPPTWETSDPHLLTLKPSEDGMTCEVFPAARPGKAKVTVRGQVEYGSGPYQLFSDHEVEVVMTPPPVGEITAEEPKEREEEPNLNKYEPDAARRTPEGQAQKPQSMASTPPAGTVKPPQTQPKPPNQPPAQEKKP